MHGKPFWEALSRQSGLPYSFWLDTFPGLQPVDVGEGFILDHTGLEAGHVVFIGEGTAVVRSVTCGGRSMVLYRCGPGSACLLPFEFSVTGPDYIVEAAAETPVRGFRVPPGEVQDAMSRSEQLTRYLVALMSRRLSHMIDRAHDLAFHGVRERIRAFLANRAAATPDRSVRITHAQLAREVGSTREVVSRVLRELAGTRELVLGRGTIRMVGDGRDRR